MRYGPNKGGYFWAYTVDGVNVVLYGRKDFEGKNKYNEKDIKGNFFIQDLIAKGKQPGGGYAEYWFPRLGGKDHLQKRSYLLLFEPFGWVVGTGYYVDDLTK